MAYVNLFGIFHEKQDGGLATFPVSDAPRILILGTSESGQGETPYIVGRSQEAAVEFGTVGTLIHGMYEVMQGGGENIVLFRVGATAAVLSGIGVAGETGGITITTVEQDASAEDSYSLYWDNSVHRLVVKNVADGYVVYDRDFDDVSPTTDLEEVFVTGTYGAGGADIGSASAFLTFAEAAEDDVGLVSGTDGAMLSRMKLFERLHSAYKLLENEQFDHIYAVDTYVDEKNIVEGTTFLASPSAVYPVVGSADDILLYYYAEESDGELLWWWRQDRESGPADIYPVGRQTTTPGGVTITTALFTEANFGYQLADFCYCLSSNQTEVLGTIGMRGPLSFSLKDLSNWIGKKPAYTQGSEGLTIESQGDNGTGLLGNKFMAGKNNYREGEAYGGLVATDTGTLGGVELKDRGGLPIDIGAYISVVGQWARCYNPFNTNGLGYITNLAGVYTGFVASLDPKEAPTNKVVPGIRLVNRIGNDKLDDLAGMRYIFCMDKPKGTVVCDAPTAARPASDYRRLTTVRIVKAVVDAIRIAGDPFIGQAGGSAQKAGLQTAIDSALARLMKGGYLSRSDSKITQTQAEKAAGFATVELTLVPAFELRQINLIISLSTE